ncbi:hypothetical protein CXF96_17100 [Stenotrophomonas sp. Betaine-02u-21]|uniref:hypothetical protein n=1 Tax=unclassified Stenotrophomonas TaxID=196198 RepID=UPI000C31C061|nr:MULTISPECIES: hypothetical protein [unclassified Stenotrophomonas]PKH70631.1 hypothetical protein CXF90_13480 [Stenotrophomonas sp. Betaine-02u-23]PKH71577.1 hypothetical protein CXF96_17100 [Stenotrophomonas sp. Betaine-02u-21]
MAIIDMVGDDRWSSRFCFPLRSPSMARRYRATRCQTVVTAAGRQRVAVIDLVGDDRWSSRFCYPLRLPSTARRYRGFHAQLQAEGLRHAYQRRQQQFVG